MLCFHCRREADMSFTSLTLTGERSESISFSRTFTRAALTILRMRKGQLQGKLSALTEVLHFAMVK